MPITQKGFQISRWRPLPSGACLPSDLPDCERVLPSYSLNPQTRQPAHELALRMPIALTLPSARRDSAVAMDSILAVVGCLVAAEQQAHGRVCKRN
jgi:hypothetical protein